MALTVSESPFEFLPLAKSIHIPLVLTRIVPATKIWLVLEAIVDFWDFSYLLRCMLRVFFELNMLHSEERARGISQVIGTKM